MTSNAPTMQLSQVGLSFTGVQGGGVIPTQSIAVGNTGSSSMNWSANLIDGWKFLEQSRRIRARRFPAGGAGSAGPSVTFPPQRSASLKAGAYYGLGADWIDNRRHEQRTTVCFRGVERFCRRPARFSKRIPAGIDLCGPRTRRDFSAPQSVCHSQRQCRFSPGHDILDHSKRHRTLARGDAWRCKR